jgi:hypothetical protein
MKIDSDQQKFGRDFKKNREDAPYFENLWYFPKVRAGQGPPQLCIL